MEMVPVNSFISGQRIRRSRNKRSGGSGRRPAEGKSITRAEGDSSEESKFEREVVMATETLVRDYASRKRRVYRCITLKFNHAQVVGIKKC